MTAIALHLSGEELEVRYETAADPVAKSHFHAVWLLSMGYKTQEVAEILSFSPRWVRDPPSGSDFQTLPWGCSLPSMFPRAAAVISLPAYYKVYHTGRGGKGVQAPRPNILLNNPGGMGFLPMVRITSSGR